MHLHKIKTIRVDLHKIRKEKKLTQKELAKKAGVSQSTISAIENYSKSPSIATVNKIAIALNIDSMKLIKNND